MAAGGARGGPRSRGADPVERGLLTSLVGNAALCALKVAGGVFSGSLALLADGTDSALNVVSASVALLSRRESRKPPDVEHRYGHELFEVYGALIVLLLMVATFSFIAFTIFDRLTHGYAERVDPVGIPFALASLALNLLLSARLGALGSESQAAKAESRHLAFDVVEGSLSLAGVALGSLVSSLYDALAASALLAAAAVLVAKMLRELKAFVTAESPPEEVVRELERALASVRGVRGVHSLRVRQAGSKLFADVHLEVDGGLTVEEAHRICDEAEREVRRRLGDVDVVIHVEPEGHG